MCYVAEDPRKEEKEWGGVPGTGSHNRGQEYKLPDGRNIKVRTLTFGMGLLSISLVQNGFVQRKFCLILKLLGQSIRVFMKCYLIQ
jgi:hypothetical protein